VFGIQFTTSWSGVLLFALLVYVGFTVFGTQRLGLSPVALSLLAVIAAALAVVSLYAHELAHALVARAYGIPVRTVSLFLLGGMAHITRESPSPRAEFLIAVSGPASSVLIGLVATLVAVATLAADWPQLAAARAVLASLAWMNISLGIFNLVPAFPLDGGRVLRGLLWYAGQDLAWASKVSARLGQVAAIGLLFAGIWMLFDGSVFGAFIGLWLILIAWFMYAGAASSRYASQFHESLRRLTVASVMDRDFGKVQAGVSVQAFAEEHLLERQAPVTPHAFAVYREDYLVGLLSLRQLGRIPMQKWAQTSVERAMLPIESAPAMEPSAPALGALHLLVEDGVEHIAVMAEGRLVGLVTRTELARATDTK
jgi:Zn-dependent protease/CBS domain-containing protein